LVVRFFRGRPARPGFKMVVDNLYYGSHPFENRVQSSFTFDEEILKSAVRRIYEKKFNPLTEIDEGVFRETWDIFNSATDKGFGRREYSDPDYSFYEELRSNNAVFSAFRVHRLQSDIASHLTDEDGKLKSFDKFAQDVEPITSHSVKHWLRTEYDTAVLRARQAADWRQFGEVKDILPNLRWLPTTSVTPDSVHRVYWQAELTLPQYHPFWREHRPGDRWNCKCSLEATDDPVHGAHVIDEDDQPKPDRGLDNNPGTDAQLFSDTHPYNPTSCAACTLPDKRFRNKWAGFFNAGRKKDCYNCSRPKELLKKAGVATKESKKAAEELSKQPDKFYKNLIIKRKAIQESHIKLKHLQFDNLKTGNIKISKMSMKAILHHIFNEDQLKAALVINKKISSLKFIRVSPLGEGKDLTNPVEISKIKMKKKKGVKNYNSYEYRYKGNIFYVKTEEVNIHGDIFERLYSFTRKP